MKKGLVAYRTSTDRGEAGPPFLVAHLDPKDYEHAVIIGEATLPDLARLTATAVAALIEAGQGAILADAVLGVVDANRTKQRLVRGFAARLESGLAARADVSKAAPVVAAPGAPP